MTEVTIGVSEQIQRSQVTVPWHPAGLGNRLLREMQHTPGGMNAPYSMVMGTVIGSHLLEPPATEP